MTIKPLDIVYDGHCGFCMRSLNVVKALDIYEKLRLHDSHDPAILKFQNSGAWILVKRCTLWQRMKRLMRASLPFAG